MTGEQVHSEHLENEATTTTKTQMRYAIGLRADQEANDEDSERERALSPSQRRNNLRNKQLLNSEASHPNVQTKSNQRTTRQTETHTSRQTSRTQELDSNYAATLRRLNKSGSRLATHQSGDALKEKAVQEEERREAGRRTRRYAREADERMGEQRATNSKRDVSVTEGSREGESAWAAE